MADPTGSNFGGTFGEGPGEVASQRVFQAMDTLARLALVQTAVDRQLCYVEEDNTIYAMDRQKTVAAAGEIAAPNGGVWVKAFGGAIGPVGPEGPPGAPTGETGETGTTGGPGGPGSQVSPVV